MILVGVNFYEEKPSSKKCGDSTAHEEEGETSIKSVVNIKDNRAEMDIRIQVIPPSVQ